MPAWEKFTAESVHVLFYILIIGIPLTGWIIVSCSTMNIPTILYGVIPWPHLPVFPDLENKKQIGHTVGEIHGFLAYVIAGLLVLHAGAAWKHHLINRDDVLLRMAPKFLHPLLNKIRGN
jgi:cytochrome b561